MKIDKPAVWMIIGTIVWVIIIISLELMIVFYQENNTGGFINSSIVCGSFTVVMYKILKRVVSKS